LFTNTQGYDAIVLNASSDSGRLSLAESQLISQSTRSAILEQLSVSNFKKAGDVRVLYNVGGVKQVAVVNLGDRKQLNQGDNLEGKRLDAARTAVSFATLLLSYDGDHVR
jgi:aminopeptidase